MNSEVLNFQEIRLEKRENYAIDYVETLLENYRKVTGLDCSKFVSGIGHRKSLHQKQYQELQGYLERLKAYAKHIEICGESRNSYAKQIMMQPLCGLKETTWEMISFFQHTTCRLPYAMNT